MAAPSYGVIDASSKRDRYEALYGRLRSDRSTYDSYWREIGDYIAPTRCRFSTSERNRVGKRDQKIINITPPLALGTLESGMHAGLTSPARPWFKLTTADKDLAKRYNVRVWLDEVTRRMLSIFEATNLYESLPTVYGDIGCFGTAAMSMLDDTEELFRTYTYPVGSYVLGLDTRGMVNTFAQEYQISIRQLIEEFALQPDGRTIDWSIVSNTVRALWGQGSYEAPVDVLWIVQPNEGHDPRLLGGKYMRFSSCYIERGAQDGTGGFLRESGFREFPIMAPRWAVTGNDTYGTRCPGMLARGDAKQLQSMERKKGIGLEKQIDPPLVGPTSLQNQKVSLLAGDITYEDVRDGNKGLRPIHDMRLDVSGISQDIQRTEYRVQRAFFVDLFLMLANSNPPEGTVQPLTAREVEERHEEKLLALGPVLDRTKGELHVPMVNRAYAMMARAKLLPDVPAELHGQAIRVEFTSILAQAQKLVGVGGQDRLLQTVGSMAQFWPEAVLKIDAKKLVDNYADMLGVDPSAIRPDEVVAAMMAEQQKRQDAAAQAEQAAKLSTAAKNAAAAPMTGDTALTRIIGNVTGAGAGGAALAGG